jgi:hypothetical protein
MFYLPSTYALVYYALQKVPEYILWQWFNQRRARHDQLS